MPPIVVDTPGTASADMATTTDAATTTALQEDTTSACVTVGTTETIASDAITVQPFTTVDVMETEHTTVDVMAMAVALETVDITEMEH
jgi:hypothetical protein